jgi:hypothetical protein
MTTVDQEAYQPEAGDYCFQEVSTDHFNIYWYVRHCWEPHGSISEAEKQRLIAARKLTCIGENKEKRQFYRQYIPQFPDGSGWDVDDKRAPYFYEHITSQEERKLKAASAKRLYKIVMILPGVEHHHKNTYFVKGSHLDRFLQTHKGFSEGFVSIEQVENIPSTYEKLT